MSYRPDRIDVHPDMVIQQLAKVAFANMLDYVTWGDESGLRLRETAQVDGTVIAEISETIGDGVRTLTVKLVDKALALEVLARYFGLIKNTVQVDVAIPLAEVLLRSAELARLEESES